MVNKKNNKLIILLIVSIIIIAIILSIFLVRKYMFKSNFNDNTTTDNDDIENDREINILNSDDAKLFVVNLLKDIENGNYNLDIEFKSEDDDNYNFVTTSTDGTVYDIHLNKITKSVDIIKQGNYTTGE